MSIKKVHIKTYGCQMNVHETEKLYAQFAAVGIDIAETIEDADIIVYNTCCIREGAETRVLGNLGIAKKLKEQKRDLIIAVCGCMTQQKDKAEYLHKRCPFINIIVGTYGMKNIVTLVLEAYRGSYVQQTEPNESVARGVENAERFGSVVNYVNITFGCNNYCTYCIVPYVKGRERSRKLSDIRDEVMRLVEFGAKEVTLLGQNVNSYRDDEGNDFYALLSELACLSGDFWIKFMTSHPKDLSKEVVRLIGKEQKLASYVHLPLQSGNDRILQAMNRHYDINTYMEKVDWIREYIPDSGLTSDVIIGFPGETEREFCDTLNAASRVRYNNLFMFLYSRRSGTPAAEMPNQIDEAIKKERLGRLIKLQNSIESELADAAIGKTYRVLCDSDGAVATGKTASDKPVVIENAEKAKKNEFVNVTITRAVGSKLYGKIDS